MLHTVKWKASLLISVATWCGLLEVFQGLKSVYYCCCTTGITKAMKSSPLLGPFGDLKFCGFSLLKLKIGWVLWCIKVQICKQSYCELMHNCLCLQILTLIHHSTQPILIFKRENPQNFKSPNGPRRGLDFIALLQVNQNR